MLSIFHSCKTSEFVINDVSCDANIDKICYDLAYQLQSNTYTDELKKNSIVYDSLYILVYSIDEFMFAISSAPKSVISWYMLKDIDQGFATAITPFKIEYKPLDTLQNNSTKYVKFNYKIASIEEKMKLMSSLFNLHTELYKAGIAAYATKNDY